MIIVTQGWTVFGTQDMDEKTFSTHVSLEAAARAVDELYATDDVLYYDDLLIRGPDGRVWVPSRDFPLHNPKTWAPTE